MARSPYAPTCIHDWSSEIAKRTLGRAGAVLAKRVLDAMQQKSRATRSDLVVGMMSAVSVIVGERGLRPMMLLRRAVAVNDAAMRRSGPRSTHGASAPGCSRRAAVAGVPEIGCIRRRHAVR